jgi:hypothetical protein
MRRRSLRRLMLTNKVRPGMIEGHLCRPMTWHLLSQPSFYSEGLLIDTIVMFWDEIGVLRPAN